ncbi:glycosyltransferase family 4 protein [Spirosoma aerolatum]|uniref:glycosyltransferase family 4 protein n=1 Tax=Spirosoma aerolatum TaxID=1211326 RepID=UPI0009ACD6D4|nr:glycosyltransferase family 4 protein [Spirosoma aerolatum]
MKVLIASFTFPPEENGVSFVAYQHALGLHKAGYEIEIATSRQANRVHEQWPMFRIHEFAVSGNGVWVRPFRGEIEAYRQFLTEFDGDVIFFHAWESWPLELAVDVLPQIRAKTVVVSHGLSFTWRPPGLSGYLRWLVFQPYGFSFRKKLSQFDHRVFLTQKVDKIRFYDHYLAQQQGIQDYTVIPNGPSLQNTPLPAGKTFRETYQIAPRRVILCVSNYYPTKGQHDLLAAFLDTQPTDTALVFIGSYSSEYSKQLEKQAGNLLNKTVYLLTAISRDQVAAAYREAVLFATASQVDVQPLMLIDAMAFGLPFVALDVAGISEFPGGITYRSPAELRQSLTELLQDDAKRSELAHQGLEAVRKTYNWATIIGQYQTLIEQLTQPSEVAR